MTLTFDIHVASFNHLGQFIYQLLDHRLHHRIPSKTSPRPLIVKFSFYKDRDRVLKAYREKRTRQNEQTTESTEASAAEQTEQSETYRVRVCEDFPESVIKARSNLLMVFTSKY